MNHGAKSESKYADVYRWLRLQPGVSDDFVHVPIESLTALLRTHDQQHNAIVVGFDGSNRTIEVQCDVMPIVAIGQRVSLKGCP